jgi:hypothetical protein
MMRCDIHDNGADKVQTWCEYYACKSKNVKYWLPLGTIELEPVDENPPAK